MRVCIIGENCQDIFNYCNFERLNPEAPTPCGSIVYQKENRGMAANVYEHFKNLDIECDFITQPETITKTRHVDIKSNYVLLRIDLDPDIKPCDKIIDFTKYDLFIISDYCKGFLTKEYIGYIVNQANLNHKEVYIDTKKILGKWSYDAWVKINEKEHDFNLKNRGNINYNKTLITLGAAGIKYRDKIYPPENQIESRDVVGAGDTALVFFSIFYHLTQNIELAISKANYYAGIACSHKGVINDFGIKYKDLI